MKIALVSPYDLAYPGGVTSHIAALGTEFARRGHGVKILAPSSTPAPDLQGVEIVTFGRSIPVPTNGSIARISVSVWHEPRLKAMLESEQFDIVHIHEPLMPMFSLMALHNSPGPTIGTFHAYSENRAHGYRLGKPYFVRAAERLDGRIAVSEAAKQFVNGYIPAEYEVIPNGIEFDHFSAPELRPGIMSPEDINLLFVGRIGEKRKGLRYLLGAYSTLKWEFPGLRLIVVGPGVPDAESYRIIGERNIQDISFVGHVPRHELPAFYQHADVFCSPATGGESFGFVLLEAMAAGRAVVASSIRGYETLISPGVNGLLVRPKDEKALAAAIRTVIQDPSMREHLGSAARSKARQFDWSNVASRVLNYYERVRSGLAPRAAIA